MIVLIVWSNITACYLMNMTIVDTSMLVFTLDPLLHMHMYVIVISLGSVAS